MCELLALAFNRPINPTFSFTGLLSGSQDNPDGWGIGYYPEQGAASIFKEALRGDDSQLAQHIACSNQAEDKQEIYILIEI